MATVSGDIRLVSDSAAPVSQVWVSAPKIRAADGAIITAFHDRFDVRQGRVSFPCRPGPARVTLVSAGQPMDSLDILVPAEEAVSLWKAAQNFQIAGEESPETLMQYLDEIRRVGASLKADIGGAKQAASQASGHANRAEQARNAAQGHANTAQGHASTAGDHARDASGHASAAASSESEASKAAVRAEGARAEARTNWDKAAEAQAGAESARDDAQGHARTAEGHASTASTQATKSENAANRLWDSVSWRGDRLTVAGRQSESLTGPQGPPGPAGTVDGLEPETIVRTGSEPTFGRIITLAGGARFRLEARDDALFVIDAETNRTIFNANKEYLQLGGDLRIAGGSIIGMRSPTGPHQPATKQYVDSLVENVTVDTSGLAERGHTHTMEQISDLRPDTLIRSGSEPNLGRTATITASGGIYYAILKQVNGSHTLEQYWTPSGDYGIYSGGSNRIVAKADVFEHHTATDMRGNELRGLRAPTADNHAANKAYVDSVFRGVDTNRIQLVDSLPSNPRPHTLYLIAE